VVEEVPVINKTLLNQEVLVVAGGVPPLLLHREHQDKAIMVAQDMIVHGQVVVGVEQVLLVQMEHQTPVVLVVLVLQQL
jgi:peptidase E